MPCMATLCALAAVLPIAAAFLRGNPNLECLPMGVRFHLDPSSAFDGHIYVRGFFSDPHCHIDYGPHPMSSPFHVDLPYIGDCSFVKQRMSDPLGILFSTLLVVQRHRQFVTRGDRAFRLNCFYRQQSANVSSVLDVGEIPSSDISGSSFHSSCEYDVLSSLDGPSIRFARVGESVIHRWKCDSPGQAFLVHSCLIKDPGGKEVELVDDRGCVRDSSLMTPLSYPTDSPIAYSTVQAFRFADQMMVFFSCQITMCDKEDNGCEGITPPQCDSLLSADAPIKLQYRNDTQTGREPTGSRDGSARNNQDGGIGMEQREWMNQKPKGLNDRTYIAGSQSGNDQPEMTSSSDSRGSNIKLSTDPPSDRYSTDHNRGLTSEGTRPTTTTRPETTYGGSTMEQNDGTSKMYSTDTQTTRKEMKTSPEYTKESTYSGYTKTTSTTPYQTQQDSTPTTAPPMNTYGTQEDATPTTTMTSTTTSTTPSTSSSTSRTSPNTPPAVLVQPVRPPLYLSSPTEPFSSIPAYSSAKFAPKPGELKPQQIPYENIDSTPRERREELVDVDHSGTVTERIERRKRHGNRPSVILDVHAQELIILSDEEGAMRRVAVAADPSALSSSLPSCPSCLPFVVAFGLLVIGQCVAGVLLWYTRSRKQSRNIIPYS